MKHPRKVRPSFSSFTDEMSKIASGDLMNPAVGADSAAVSGPPASPFASKKGYRKLERTAVVKEGSALRFAVKGLRKTKAVGKAALRAVERVNPAAVSVYSGLPKPLKSAVDYVAANPSDFASAPDTIMRLLGR